MFIRFKIRKRTTWKWRYVTEDCPAPDGAKTREVDAGDGYVYEQWCESGLPDYDGSNSVTVLLIEALRVDGKPRQRHVGSLGTMRAVDPPDTSAKRIKKFLMFEIPGGWADARALDSFWKRILDRLGELVPDGIERKAVVKLLTAKLYKPTRADIRLDQRALDERMAAFERKYKLRP